MKTGHTIASVDILHLSDVMPKKVDFPANLLTQRDISQSLHGLTATTQPDCSPTSPRIRARLFPDFALISPTLQFAHPLVSVYILIFIYIDAIHYQLIILTLYINGKVKFIYRKRYQKSRKKWPFVSLFLVSKLLILAMKRSKLRNRQSF